MIYILKIEYYDYDYDDVFGINTAHAGTHTCNAGRRVGEWVSE